MISIPSIREAVSALDHNASVVTLDDSGRQAVKFRAFSTDAMITATHPEGEALVGCVIFAEVQDPALSEALVNEMNQRINFGGVAYFEPSVAIVKSRS